MPITNDRRTKNTRQIAPGLATDAGTSYAYDLPDPNHPGQFLRQDRVTDALGHVTQTDYDGLGQATKVTYDDGSFSETLDGTNSQAVSRSDIVLPDNPGDDFPATFDGQHVVKIAQRKAGEPLVVTHYLYNVQGQLTDVWQPEVTDATDGVDKWPHWHYTYDTMGEQASITDPNGHVTTFADTYDVSGHKTSHTRTLPAVGGVTVTETTTFDALGRTLTVTDFKGQTTLYRYEDSPGAQGRLYAEYRYAAGQTVDATTIANPESSALTSARWYAEKTTYTFDNLGRQQTLAESTKSPTTGVVTQSRLTIYGYDPVTGAINLVDSPEGKVHHEYDPATGLLTRTWTGTSSPSTDTLYGYDQLGRLASVTSAKVNGSAPTAPHVQRNRYDATGNILVAAASNALPTTTYDYDAAGNLKSVNLPSGNVESYVYDDLNRLTSETITRPDNASHPTEDTFDYTLLSNGQRDHVVETRYNADGSVFSANKINWAYDTLGRLTSEVRDVGNDGPDTSDYRHDFAYDLAGNRLSEKIDIGNDDVTAPETSIGYVYDERDRLLTETATGVNAYVITYGHFSGATLIAGYDANGSLLEEHRTGYQPKDATYVWSLRNRMTSATENGASTAYTYDSDGLRVRELTGSTDTYYLTAQVNPTGYGQTLEQWTAGSASPDASYVWGQQLISQSRGATITFYLQDELGSTRGITDASGSVTDTYDYEAFGKLIALTGTTPNVYEFAGQHVDQRLGWSYNRARWYGLDGRLQSRDDYSGNASKPLTLHKYAYAQGNPVSGTDPSGYLVDLGSLPTTFGAGETVDAAPLPATHAALRFSWSEIAFFTGLLAVHALGYYGLDSIGASSPGMSDVIAAGGAGIGETVGYNPQPAKVWRLETHLNSITNEDTLTSSDLRNMGFSPDEPDREPTKIYYLPEDQFPNVALHVVDAVAWGGQSQYLHYNGGGPAADANRAAWRSRPNLPAAGPDENLDEYPFAIAREGGANADIKALNARENRLQGTDLSGFIRFENIVLNQPFFVMLVPSRWFSYYD